MSTLHGTVILHGVELDVMSDCECHWQDDSFDHEFGTEHCGHAEVEEIDFVELDLGSSTLRQCVLEDTRQEGHSPHRRLFLKRMRRIRKRVSQIDPDTFWTKKQLEAVESEWKPPEPDYDLMERE